MNTLQELLQKQWVKRDGTPDYKMADYCLKSSIYIQSGDAYIDVGNAKPTINTTLWFDDETDTPEVTFDYFRHYNRHNFPRPLNEKQYFVTPQYRGDRTGGRLLGFTIDDGRTNARPATPQEIMDANEALLNARFDYEKRLERYWKRYSNKVHASGYWVNR